MKDLLVEACSTVEDINTKVWQNGALGHGGVPAQPAWPFILFRQVESVPYRQVQDTSRAARHDYVIYVFDERGSYARIERILAELRDTLISLEGSYSPSGVLCTGVEWFGTSGDLVNEELNSNTKFVTVRITASI